MLNLLMALVNLYGSARAHVRIDSAQNVPADTSGRYSFDLFVSRIYAIEFARFTTGAFECRTEPMIAALRYGIENRLIRLEPAPGNVFGRAIVTLSIPGEIALQSERLTVADLFMQRQLMLTGDFGFRCLERRQTVYTMIYRTAKKYSLQRPGGDRAYKPGSTTIELCRINGGGVRYAHYDRGRADLVSAHSR